MVDRIEEGSQGLEGTGEFLLGAEAGDCRQHVGLFEPFHDGAGEEAGALADLNYVAVARDVEGEELVVVGVVEGALLRSVHAASLSSDGHVVVELIEVGGSTLVEDVG
jgi:hypothetical protein